MANDKIGVDQTQSAGESMEALQYLQRVYQNRYMLIVGEINELAEAIKDISSSQKTLEHADKIASSEVLIPIGSAVYTHGSIKELSSAIVGIGGGYFTEKNVDDAKKFIAKRLDKTTKALERLMKERSEIEGAILDISYRADALSAGNR